MATSVLGLKTFAASDPVDYNEINDNYNKIDSGVKTALQGRAEHNLLDNSDFRNPVNQRGKSSYSGTGGKVYTIDRWHTWSASISVSVQSGYLSVTNSTDSIYQNISQIIDKHNLTGKAATIAVWDTNDNVYCASGLVSTNNEIACNTPTDFWFSAVLEDDNTIYFTIKPRGAKTAKLKAAALYEGSYTADTLPAYQPKGYAAELAECQRYYENSWFGVGKTDTQEYIANVWSSGQADARIEFKQQKRVSPTITFYPIGTESNWKIFNGGYQIVNSVENIGRGGLSGFIARVSKGNSDGTTWTPGCTIQAQGHWEASADL